MLGVIAMIISMTVGLAHDFKACKQANPGIEDGAAVRLVMRPQGCLPKQ